MQRRRVVLREIWRPDKRVLQFRYLSSDVDEYADIPRPNHRWERKPYPTPMKLLIRRAKAEKQARKENPCQILEPPDNGLLVPELVEVAHRVYQARKSLLHGLSRLVDAVVPVKRCRYCSEIHIGHVGHEIRTCSGPNAGLKHATHIWRKGGIEDVVYFPLSHHLKDRVGQPRIIHDERFRVERIPAILELCIQAGLDIQEYPTKRRNKPVYSIEGRIVDFDAETEATATTSSPAIKSCPIEPEKSSNELSLKTLGSWFDMRAGAEKIMKKYSVKTCGYCPEVQVGPKGHKVRLCRAAKHQFRNGLHAWQEATIDDLVGPNYVWHITDVHGAALVNEAKRFYGKAPAIVELCVQAGAPVPKEYRRMMRLDVITPCRDEIDLVA